MLENRFKKYEPFFGTWHAGRELGEGAFGKMTFMRRSSGLLYIDTFTRQLQYEKDSTSELMKASADTSNVFTELVGDKNFNDSYRLSSKMVVSDKHITERSSEGYYMYIFKEYSKNRHENMVWLKFDFYHAGIGKVIPMIVPRAMSDSNSGIGTPYYLHKSSDLTKLKEGFSTKDIYKQTYLPMYVKFDDVSKRYVYYLPESLKTNTELKIDSDIMSFTLFETKFKNESF